MKDMTNELGSVIENNRPVVSSRKVAEVFEKEHYNVIRDIRNLECSKSFADLNFELSEYEDITGRVLPEYLMTRDGFSFLAMGFTGAKAAAWKERYIAAFNAIEQELMARVQLPDFTNPVIAARAWADEVEKKLSLQAKIDADAPHTHLGKAITRSSDCITVADFVPIMKQAGITHGYDGKRLWQNNLYDMLRTDGFLLKRPKNKPSADSRTLNLFFVEETTTLDAFGKPHINAVTLVTGKGQSYLTDWYKSHIA